jgi:hypothetical protein
MPALNSKLKIDFSDYIADRTKNFTGREWVFETIQNWLAAQDSDRYFLLTGQPGSGKTAIAARLAQFTQGEANYPSLKFGFLQAIHFCSSSRPTWIDPRDFVVALALQLGQIPAYAEALVNVGEKQLNIHINQTIDRVENSTVTGVSIQTLDLSGLISAQELFNLIVINPLLEIYQKGYRQPTIILVDSLDEALLHSGLLDIVDLLSKLDELPHQVRFIVTSRPETEILERFKGSTVCDLTKDAGLAQSQADISQYVSEVLKLQSAIQPKLSADLTTERFISKIKQYSEGNFLYVIYLLQMLTSQNELISEDMLQELPIGLSGIYASFLQRLLQENTQNWRNDYAPLLGILAVAQAPLTLEQLADFLQQPKSKVGDVLDHLIQFLDRDETLPASQRTYSMYHRSLANWLLDEDQADRYFCDPLEHLEYIIKFYQSENGWEHVNYDEIDNYGLRYLATHLAEAARLSKSAQKHQYTQSLVELVSSPDFQRTHQSKLGNLAALQQDVTRALDSASVDHDPDAIPLVIEMALATIAFRETWLNPEPIFLFAQAGNIAAAEQQLGLFSLKPEWQQVTLLTIAWLAAQQNPDEARQLRDRIIPNLFKNPALDILMQKLNVELENQVLPDFPSLANLVTSEVIEAILNRLGGSIANNELLMNSGIQPLVNLSLLAEPDNALPFYISEQDGPVLVTYAIANPQAGLQYLQQYIDIHSAYNYREYRNNSLMILLTSVLKHPDSEWLRQILPKLVTAAFGVNHEFRESLLLTLWGCQAEVGKTTALDSLHAFIQPIRQEVMNLPDSNLGKDPYLEE